MWNKLHDMKNMSGNREKEHQGPRIEGLPERFVITIGRRMGSGGRALGRLLSERLGIEFYDRKLLLEAAGRAGLSPEIFERSDERRPHFINGLFSFDMGLGPVSNYTRSSISDDAIYTAQCDFIRELATRKSCVIVGRTADYVLRDMPNVVNVFVHADAEDCAKRITERQPSLSHDQARRLSEKTNKLRSGFYNFYTDKRWGDSGSYDMTFNSSTMSLEDIADIIIDYIQRKFKK